MASTTTNSKVFARNRRAYHEYTIERTLEAGVALVGTEVKAIRAGAVTLTEGWVDVRTGEAFLRQVRIGAYSHGNRENHDEHRPRKLLLKRREITDLERAQGADGMTLIPLKVYLKGQRVKIEIGVARGKKLYDKRARVKERDAHRSIDRAIKDRNRR